jgi:hypothetical protein
MAAAPREVEIDARWTMAYYAAGVGDAAPCYLDTPLPGKEGPAIDETTAIEGAFSAKTTLTWACTPEGLRAPGLGKSFPMAAIEESARASDEDTGVDLPRAERWKVGAAWTRRAEQRAKSESGSKA